MSRCPFADWRPIHVEGSARRIRPWGVVMHTAVSNSDALKPWDEVEWHFYVGEQGQLTQFRDTEIEADCQLDGTYFGGRGHISIETWDGAGAVWDGRDVSDIPRWTDAQVRTIGRLLAWLHDEHGIPLRRIDAWNGRGIGYHRQFTSNSYPRWNETHACPGNRRINQIGDLLAAARNQEDDMPSEKEIWDHRINNYRINAQGDRETQGTRQVGEAVADLEMTTDFLRRQNDHIEAQNKRIDAKLDALAGALGPAVKQALEDATVQVDVNVTGGDQS